MSASTSRSLHSRLALSSTKGLLALSPELILEISSHIISWDDLRSTQRDASFLVTSTDISNPVLTAGKKTLANLRLTCRYLGEVLERELFKSHTFYFHVKQSWSEADVDTHLASLARGDDPASRHAKFLLVKCLDPTRQAYVPGGTYFSDQKLDFDATMQAKAASVTQSMTIHLEKAVLSFQHLRCVVWKIDEVDIQNIRLMSALSSLASLEDLTLCLRSGFEELSDLRIDKFHDLRSLAVIFEGGYWYYGEYLEEPPSQIVDHISDIVSRSPLLCHLSVLQPHDKESKLYNISLHRLTMNISGLEHLESLHMALTDIIPETSKDIHQLKSLQSLRIDGPVESPTCNGSELWEALAGARIELQDVTVSYLSDSLLTYLASYSGLKRLRILMMFGIPDSDEQSMRGEIDTQVFFNDTVPLHSLSLRVNPEPGHLNQFLPSAEEGFIFEAGKQDHLPSTNDMLPRWRVSVCIDSVPHALKFVVDCSTKLPECRAEKLEISFSRTRHEFRRGPGERRYQESKCNEACKWMTSFQVAEQDVLQYPPFIILQGEDFMLMPSDDNTDFYNYR